MYKLKAIFEASASPSAYASRYFARLAELLAAVDPGAVEQMIRIIEKNAAEGRTLFLIGNGGSSAVASHFVNDAVAGSMIDGQPPLRAFSLTDSIDTVTAIANDHGYNEIFAYQLQAYMKPGDLVIAMSASGNSENILRGVEAAKRIGGTTIGWAGFEGGRLAQICDLCIRIPATPDEYGPVEDIFSILEHVTVTYLTLKRGRKLHH